MAKEYPSLEKLEVYELARELSRVGWKIESRHWADLLAERGKLSDEYKKKFLSIYSNLRPALNGLIKSALDAKNGKT